MPKVKFNRIVESFSGRIGDLVFYEADGQTLSRTLPQVPIERSERQVANSERFLAAQRYAATALQDPKLKAAYKAVCRGHQNPRNLAIRDAMRPPVVESFDLTGYSGKPGEFIRVHATDDFCVVEVRVTLRDSSGGLIEEGFAEPGPKTGEWCYAVQKAVAPGQSVSMTAVAQDTPGNTTENQRWYYLS